MSKLTANSEFEKSILEFYEKNASSILRKKTEANGKSIQGCAKYIIEEARKKSEGNVSVLPDETVFGMVIHYFEEDDINYEAKAAQKKVVVAASGTAKTNRGRKPSAAPAPAKKIPIQMSLFDGLPGIIR